MKQFDTNMKRKNIVEYSEIEKFYPKSFIPLEFIKDHTFWTENKIEFGRCSAFSKFFTTYEELVENIDNASNENKETFRVRFHKLLLGIKKNHKIYRQESRKSSLNELLDLKMETTISLIEECGVNLFIPDIQIVFIGHDYFGFIVLSEANNPFIKDLEFLIASNQLYLHKSENIRLRNG